MQADPGGTLPGKRGTPHKEVGVNTTKKLGGEILGCGQMGKKVYQGARAKDYTPQHPGHCSENSSPNAQSHSPPVTTSTRFFITPTQNMEDHQFYTPEPGQTYTARSTETPDIGSL